MINGPAVRRFQVFFGLLILTSLVVLGRYAWLMLGTGQADTAPAPTPPDTERGSILDRNGRLLAIQTGLSAVAAWRPDVTDAETAAVLLADILDMSAGEITTKLTDDGGSRFVFIMRKASPTQAGRIRDLMEQGRLPVVFLQPEPGRNYP